MSSLIGHCQCGQIQMTIETAVEPGTFAPRNCDCDFCLANSVCYFSDAKGSLNFQIQDQDQITWLRQGSETAEFLKCLNCGKILAATYRENGRTYASVNANLITTRSFFKEPLPVSPKNLSKSEKIQRWKELWFQKVEIRGN